MCVEGSRLRMTATFPCPIFRVSCDLLSVAVMARLMQFYGLIKKQMFMLRSHQTFIARFFNSQLYRAS